MTQAEIYNFLKKNSPNKFSAKEISINLNLKEASCFSNLKRLVKFKDIFKAEGKYWLEQ